jgi:uncharacterized repeat protein (TIGR01451 family)
MARGEVDVVVTGADRVAANGDTANKIGTYTLAVLARRHGLPFYIAAPVSTLDLGVPDGSAIPIEERDPREVNEFRGVRVTPPGVAARYLALDVTPPEQVTAVITAVVENVAANQDGVRYTNTATLGWYDRAGAGVTPVTSNPVTTDLVEPLLIIEKSAFPTNVRPGDTVFYTLRIYHAPTSTVPAYNVLISDTLNARVQILSSVDGSPAGGVGRRGLYIGQLVRPKGVALDGEGNVYAVESYFDHLLVYNRRGEFLMAIGGVGDAPGRFHLPAGVWVDGRNRIFVADTLNRRVSVFQFLGGGAEND